MRKAQSGAALLIILAIMVLAFSTLMTRGTSSSNRSYESVSKDAAVLAQAKAALIAYAITSTPPIDGSNPNRRPGDLPCPDRTGDGIGDACGNAAGTTGQANRLGRLPWRDLGLSELKDSSGEPLWYAVSNNFKNNTRIPALNSNTALGTITLRNTSGAVTNNGSNPGGTPSGIIAVVIAPGPAINRQGVGMQNRAATNVASNFLETITINGVTEDNADFIDGSSTNGFIQGPLLDPQGQPIVNDRLLAITYDDLLPLIEQRVVKEVLTGILQYQNASMPIPRLRPANINDTSCIGTASINNFNCPSATLPASTWCNGTTLPRTLIIPCNTSPNHPSCSNTGYGTPIGTRNLEIVCTATATVASLTCATPPGMGGAATDCAGRQATDPSIVSACTYTGPRNFSVEACSGRTWAMQNPPLNCGRVPIGLGVVLANGWAAQGNTNLGNPAGTTAWFHANGWRELTVMAYSPSLIPNSTDCGTLSNLTLTLNNYLLNTTSPTPTPPLPRVLVALAGRPLPTQPNPRTNITNLNDYFESPTSIPPPKAAGTIWIAGKALANIFNDTVLSNDPVKAPLQ